MKKKTNDNAAIGADTPGTSKQTEKLVGSVPRKFPANLNIVLQSSN